MSDSHTADAAADDGVALTRREARRRQHSRDAEPARGGREGIAAAAIDADQVGTHGDAATSADAASGAAGRPGGAQRKRNGLLMFLRDVIVIVLIAVLISFLIKTFLVRSFYIPSSSMEDTLLVDDRILVDQLTPLWNEYERGEIVVFADPGGWLPDPPQQERSAIGTGVDWFLTTIGLSASDSEEHLVKRLIGLPGDHVVCCNALGQITVNGEAVDELSYLKLPDGDTRASIDAFDVVVPEDSIWVLGDNRNRSKDSRYNTEQPGAGFVPVDNVVGRAFLITWPFDRFGWMEGTNAFVGVPDAE